MSTIEPSPQPYLGTNGHVLFLIQVYQSFLSHSHHTDFLVTNCVRNYCKIDKASSPPCLKTTNSQKLLGTPISVCPGLMVWIWSSLLKTWTPVYSGKVGPWEETGLWGLWSSQRVNPLMDSQLNQLLISGQSCGRWNRIGAREPWGLSVHFVSSLPLVLSMPPGCLEASSPCTACSCCHDILAHLGPKANGSSLLDGNLWNMEFT